MTAGVCTQTTEAKDKWCSTRNAMFIEWHHTERDYFLPEA